MIMSLGEGHHKIHKSSVCRSSIDTRFHQHSQALWMSVVLLSSLFCRQMAAADAVRGHIITLTSHVNNWKFNIIFPCNATFKSSPALAQFTNVKHMNSFLLLLI